VYPAVSPTGKLLLPTAEEQVVHLAEMFFSSRNKMFCSYCLSRLGVFLLWATENSGKRVL
jgi:hypothetical protein